MKISIITIAYNSAKTIEDTILSVLAQDYKNIEYIIVDGGSTDATPEIIEKHGSAVAKYISEADAGIYDAMNKGVAMATGDVVGVLNSDDFYPHSSVLSSVVKQFTASGADALYGDLRYVDRSDTAKTVRYWKSGAYKAKNFLNGWMPPHPAFFAKRSLYTSYGAFRTDLRSSADYELMLRFLYKHRAATTYLQQVLVHMRVGGQSNVSLKNRIAANREDKRAWQLNGLKPGPFTFIQKPLSKIFQWVLHK